MYLLDICLFLCCISYSKAFVHFPSVLLIFSKTCKGSLHIKLIIICLLYGTIFFSFFKAFHFLKWFPHIYSMFLYNLFFYGFWFWCHVPNLSQEVLAKFPIYFFLKLSLFYIFIFKVLTFWNLFWCMVCVCEYMYVCVYTCKWFINWASNIYWTLSKITEFLQAERQHRLPGHKKYCKKAQMGRWHAK